MKQPETAAELEAQRLLYAALEVSLAEIAEEPRPVTSCLSMPDGSITFMLQREVNGELRRLRPYFLPGGELEMVSLAYGKSISLFKEPSHLKRFIYQDIWETLCMNLFGERKQS